MCARLGTLLFLEQEASIAAPYRGSLAEKTNAAGALLRALLLNRCDNDFVRLLEAQAVTKMPQQGTDQKVQPCLSHDQDGSELELDEVRHVCAMRCAAGVRQVCARCAGGVRQGARGVREVCGRCGGGVRQVCRRCASGVREVCGRLPSWTRSCPRLRATNRHNG